MKHNCAGISKLGKLARRAIDKFKQHPDFFLKKVKGVMHVGAHFGEESDLYAAHNLNVLWIEPIPESFAQLVGRIAPHPKQRALCHLVTDMDDQEYNFHVSSNEGASSSILALGHHTELWPEISFTKTIKLKSLTLSSLVKRERIDLCNYDSLVMDTQGSELLILKGAIDLLPKIKFIMTEVADFESYQNCCQLPEIDRFLRQYAFRRVVTERFAHKPGIGSYFNVTYVAGV